VDADRKLVGWVHAILVPVGGIAEYLDRLVGDLGGINSCIRFLSAKRSSPFPNVTEHPSMQLHQEGIFQNLCGAPASCSSLSFGEVAKDVLVFDLIEVGSGSDEARYQASQVFLVDRGGA
jgi:hypothetical protein